MKTNEKIIFEKKVIMVGDSKAITLPKQLLDYLSLDVGDELQLLPDRSKHGIFVAIWKKEVENEGSIK